MQSLVVGSSLNALIYSYKMGLPVLFVKSKPPTRFGHLPGDLLSGITQRQAWEALMFILNLSGLLLFPNMLNGLKVENTHLIAKTDRSTIKIKFDNLVIFDDSDIDGLPKMVSEIKEKNRVIDWVNVRSSGRHEIDYLYDDDDFVSEVIFYPSDRSDNKNHKDLIAISYLTDEEVLHFDYSSTMARFKILDMMKKAGVKGKRNGRDTRDKSKYKYYAIKLEPAKRSVENLSKRIYERDDRFIFMEEGLAEILNMKDINHPMNLWETVCHQTPI
tara:strand:- start:5609 stop:6427 length:819 start_codon:yes stop_codon:yes gene_type:complete